MPVVPHNTMSEPTRVRAPDIFIARPRMAEAMGAVTSALGARAGAIGRNADAQGAIANEYGRQNAIRERTTLARVALNERMTDTLVGLGTGMMRTAVDIERISDRRAEDEANQAMTQFTNTLNMRTSGYTDPQTGELVKGTFEAPYAPADAKTEAQGPSIATAKAVKEWYDDENGPYARMSPAAKKKFEQKAGSVYQTVMAKAGELEYKQMQAFRQENQKAAVESRRNLMRAAHGTPEPNDAGFWSDAAMNAKELAAYGLEGMARNPDGTYAAPDAQRYYTDTQRDYLRTFAADRVDTLFTKAQAEENDAVREEMLAAGINTAAYQMNGTHLFNEQEFADLKVKADAIRKYAESQKSAALSKVVGNVRNLQVGVWGNLVDPKEYQAALEALPPNYRLPFLAEDAEKHKVEQWAQYEDLAAIAATTGQQADVDALTMHIKGMTDLGDQARAIATTQNMLKASYDARQKAAEEERTLVENEALSELDLMILTGKYPNQQTGAYDPLDDRDKFTLAKEMLGSGMIRWRPYLERKAEIAKGMPLPPDIVDLGIQTIEKATGTDILNDAFQWTYNGVSIKESAVTIPRSGKKSVVPYYQDDASVGEIEVEIAGGKRRRKELSAGLVRDVLQATVEWRRAQVSHGKEPDKRDTAAFIASLLDFNGKNALPSAKALVEDVVRQRIYEERKTINKLYEDMNRQEQISATTLSTAP